MKHIATSVLILAALCGSASASVVISSGATSHMNCSGGVCTPTSKNAVLNVSQLQTMLAASDATVNTGSGAVSIAISSPLTWASANRLTLSASQGVAIKAAVVVEGTGAMTIAPSGGALNFYPGGSISFWDNSSSLIISGNSYTLVSDLATLNADVGSTPAGFYALAKDYDASGDSFPQDAAVTTPLTGTFEGLGHTISGFTINAFDDFDIGLFEEIDGTARDLSMTGGDISCDLDNSGADVGMFVGENKGSLKSISVAGVIDCGRADHAGGVASVNTAPGVIANVTSSVTIAESRVHFAGGVAGENTGTIQNASASGTVHGATAGGLVGSTTGLVQDSHATGNVSNSTGYFLGGLAGTASGTILRCSATGNVSGKKKMGGLVGQASSLTIDSSFATGTATSAQQGGGLVGYAPSNVTVINSYARGAASGSGAQVGYAGGLVGWSKSSGSVTASYSTGAPSGAKYTGGSVGNIGVSTAMTNVYWDLDTSGVTDPSKGAGNSANYPGITGLTTAQFQSGLPAGFNPAIWAQSPSINNGYPYLIANPPQ